MNMKRFLHILLFSAFLWPVPALSQSAPSLVCDAAFTYIQDTTDQLIVNFFDQSTGNPTHWFWDFGDGSTASGQVLSHAFPEIGIYTVCLIISNTDTLQPCADTFCTVVDLAPKPKYQLGGLLYAGNFPINNPFHTGDFGYAYLYRLESGEILPVDSMLFDTLGYYYFTEVTEGDYLVKAGITPASAHFANYMPGYYTADAWWTDADTIHLNRDLFMAHIHMPPIQGLAEGGISVIGYVQTDGLLEGNERVENCEIVLRDSAGYPVRVTYTDADGMFGFNALPDGSFSVTAEYTGLYSDLAFLDLTEYQQAYDTIRLTLHQQPQAIGEGGEARSFEAEVYPNPANGALNLSVTGSRSGSLRYEVISPMGRVSASGRLNLWPGTSLHRIEAANLPAGLYLIHLQEDNTSSRQIIRVILL